MPVFRLVTKTVRKPWGRRSLGSGFDDVSAGEEPIGELVATISADVDRRLHGAAALSLLAHVEDLTARGIVACAGAPSLGARYRLERG